MTGVTFFALLLLSVLVICRGERIIFEKISEEEQKATLAFWTPERIAQAVPIEQIDTTHPFHQKLDLNDTKLFEETGFVEPVEVYKEYPYATIGKLFFQVPQGYAYCSASSTGKNAILTAAHCVWRNNRVSYNFMFMPQYLNQRAPLGRFPGKAVITHEEWRKNENMGRDVAFIVLQELRNKTLEEHIGKLPIGSCDVGTDIRSFGYPRPEFGGEKMVRTITKIYRRYPVWYTPRPVGWRSKMQNGSSGGPIIQKFEQGNNSTGEANVACSVVSFGIQYTYYVFGPFFDKDVLDMRQRAINAF